jgi:hypothetical protein
LNYSAGIGQIMNGDSKNQQRLYPIFTLATALAFGCMLATVEALRPDSAGFSFEVSYKTLIAFVAGGAIAFPLWRIILNGTKLGQRNLSLATGAMVVILLVLGVGAFLYPLRFVPRDKWPEIRTGLITAVCALSGVACLLWGVKRFVDADEKENENEEIASTKRTKSSDD